MDLQLGARLPDQPRLFLFVAVLELFEILEHLADFVVVRFQHGKNVGLRRFAGHGYSP
ncbi:hypothetical protein D3C83_320550 [compost metagenome]